MQLSFWEGTRKARAHYLPSQEPLPFTSEPIDLPGRGDPNPVWLDRFLTACRTLDARVPTLTECQDYWDRGSDPRQAAIQHAAACKGD